VNIKIRVCQIIGPAAAGSAGPVPTALLKDAFFSYFLSCCRYTSCCLDYDNDSMQRLTYVWMLQQSANSCLSLQLLVVYASKQATHALQ